MKHTKWYLSCLVSLCITFLQAQDCPYFPADCPDNGSLEASHDSSQRIQNGLLPQEIQMQDRVRQLVTSQIYQAARTLHWRAEELDEYTNLDPFQSGGTPYKLRSPRGIGIWMQCIVSNDSLKAWRSWLQDYAQQAVQSGQQASQQYADVTGSPQYKACWDSVNHYIEAAAHYAESHKSEGASLFSDREYLRLTEKQKSFTDKLAALTSQPSAESQHAGQEQEKKRMTQAFFASSVVQVFVTVNSGVGIVHSSDNQSERIGALSIPGTFRAFSVEHQDPQTNTLPFHYNRWSHEIVLFLGHWLPQKDPFQNYSSAFTRAGQADEHTPKQVLSDQVQTISIHLAGSPSNMLRLLKLLDLQALNALIRP
ncbi:MAG TPA: hypothetical protein VG870_02550 [Chitinophagaceae bacterium]|nr:hypothetical protein [Chitinophagaceae bacterium]